MKPSLTLFFLAQTFFAFSAEDPPVLYETAVLSQAKPRLESRVREIFSKGIGPFLTVEEQERLKGLKIEFPLSGKNGGLIDFYSRPDKSTVTLPILSLLFIEDLSTAFSWLYYNQYSLKTLEEYVSMLKYRKASVFKDRKYPPMLRTLGIPEKALDDRRVDELSLRIRNSAFAFILAHELGHIRYRHPGYETGVRRAQARSNEEEADRFAIDVLRRTSTLPMGIIVFFEATVYWFPNRGDYPVTAEGENSWEQYLEREASHPATPDRMRALGELLKERADDFTANDTDKAAARESVIFIAKGISEIAEFLDNNFLQIALARYAAVTEPSLLVPRREDKRPKAP